LEADVEAAKEELKQAQLELSNIQSDGNSTERSIARAKYESGFATLKAARAALANYELRAPFDGTVLSLDIEVGQVVAFIGNSTLWSVETTDLAEIDIASVSMNDLAVIKLDAFPDEEFTATVTEIDPVGREYLGDMTYKVTLELDDVDERFMWNMTATVIIDVK